MRNLIIPDIHLHYKSTLALLEKEEKKCDKVIFLGDYFDDFGDNVDETSIMAQLLKDKFIYNDKYVCLLGNHDLAYMCRSRWTCCSGFSWEKSQVISKILSAADWQQFKDFVYIDGWLLSHAGFSPKVYTFLDDGFNELTLTNLIKSHREMALNNGISVLYGAGFARGGSQPCGGHVWQDFNHELIPLKNVKQIVGHTPHLEPQVKFFGNSSKVCNQTFYRFNGWKTHPEIVVDLDCKGRYYGILEDGTLHISKNQVVIDEQDNVLKKTFDSIQKDVKEFGIGKGL